MCAEAREVRNACCPPNVCAAGGRGSRGLDVDLTDACTELLLQAGDPGVCARSWAMQHWRNQRWGGVGGGWLSGGRWGLRQEPRARPAGDEGA